MSIASEMFSARWFRIDVYAILAFLTLQFILGMVLNLFVTFPSIPPGSPDPVYFNAIISTPFLLEHFIVGVGLLLGSIWILLGAAYIKNHRMLAASTFGFLAILVAYVSGFEFLLSGFQDDVFSFSMSMGFIVALAAYIALLRLSGGSK